MKLGLGLGLGQTGGSDSPPFASDLFLRIDDTSSRYSDTGGTTLQTTDGGAVNAVRDTVSGYLAARTAGSAVLRSNRYAKAATEYTGATFSFGAQAAFGALFNLTRNWTCIWLAKPTGSGTMTALWNGTARTQMQWTTNATRWQVTLVGGNPTAAPSDATTVPHTYGYSPYYDLGTGGSDVSRSYIAGAPVQAGNAPAASATDNSNAWNMPGGGGNFSGDILACYVYKRRLLPHEYLAVSDHLYARFGLTNPRAAAGKVVVWQGNSISVLNQFPMQIPELVRANLSLPVGSVFQLAQTSKSWAQINAEGPGMTDPLLAYLKSSPIGPGDPCYVNWEGENSTVIADLWADLTARVAAGGVRRARIVVGNVKSRGVSSWPNWATTNQVNNPLIAAQLGVNYGALADVASDSILGNSGTPNGMDDATYSPDKVHLNNTSVPLAVPYFAGAIAGL